jgi:hypothetical protein
MPTAARATPSGGVPRVNGAGSGSAPQAAKGTGAAAIPNVAKSQPMPRAKPSIDSDRLRTEPDRANTDLNDAPTKVGGAAFPDDAVPPPVSAPMRTPSAPVKAPAALPAPMPSARAVPAIPAAASMFSAEPSPLSGPDPFALPPAIVAPPPAQRADSDAGEDDMEIGEVSRVVNLADLMRQPPKERAGTQAGQGPAVRRSSPALGAVGNRTGSAPAIGNRTGSVNRLDPSNLGVGAAIAQTPGGVPVLSPDAMADAAQPALFAPPTPARSQRNLVILLIAAVVLLGGVGAAVVFVLTNSDDETINIGLGPTNDQIDTTRPEDQVRHNPLLLPPIPGVGSSTTAPHYNGGGTIHHPSGSNGGSTTAANGGKVESDPLGATTALKADEVEDMSAKQSSGSTRCWERALRKQPYLEKDVKKVAITITVDALGGVTNVQIAGMPADDGNLGNCLQSFIRAWKFRQSSAGITAKFSMVFQN